VLLLTRRDATAARRFFTRALGTPKVIPTEVVTDAAPVYPGVLEQLLPTAWHPVEQHANNPIADHGQLKRRLRSIRGLQTDRTAQVVIAGHGAWMTPPRESLYAESCTRTPRAPHPTSTRNYINVIP
jgi:transposase-like protein